MLDSAPEAAFDRLTALVTAVLHVPVALVSLVDANRQFFKSCVGLPEPWARERETPLSHSFRRHVVEAAAPLVIDDARTHPLVHDNEAVVDLGVVAYLGIPLATPDGHVLGSLCAIDSVPRAWSARDVSILAHLASLVMTEVALRTEIADRRHAEAARGASDARYQSLLDTLPHIVYQAEPEPPYAPLYVSPAVEALGYSHAEWLARPDLWLSLVHPDDRARVVQEIAAAHAAGVAVDYEYRLVARNGDVHWMHDRGALVHDPEGRPVVWQGVMVDVTTQREAEAARRVSEERLALALASTRDGLWDWHVPTGTVYFTARLMEMLGYAPGEFPAHIDTFRALLHPEDAERVTAALDAHFAGRAAEYVLELRLRTSAGGWRWVLSRGEVVVRDAGGAPVRMVGTHVDIEERKALEAELVHQARHDALTGLANRAQFHAHLTRALTRVAGAASHTPVTVAFVDLDDFKTINDSHGHAAGDAVLVAVAERLLGATRGTDTVARLGGDEFAVPLGATRPGNDVAIVVPRLLQTLARPIAFGAHDLRVSASIGVARAELGQGADDLMRHADAAMYRAKRSGKHRHALFSAAEDGDALDRVTMQTELTGAHDRGEISLVYQPIVDLATGRPVGAEALARWQHPQRGLVAPDVFIPLAESTGWMPALGRWILRTACAEAAGWARGADGRQPALSVNVSGRQLESAPFLEEVTRVLRDTGLPADRLTLEVTESLLLTNPTATRARLEALRTLGVRVACDDFGTGYSSLTAVRHLPLDSLKIDKVFIRGLTEDATQHALTQAVVQLARALKLATVAEGVETGAERDALLAMGCQCGQGYLYARPLPPDAVRAYFAAPHDARRGAEPGAAGVTPGAPTPLATPPTPAAPGAVPERVPVATVLVVDDDAGVRQLLQRMIASAGYQTCAAVDGADALRVLATPRAAVDVVLSDVVMPELSGCALSDLLAVRYPAVRVLLMSGYDPTDLAESGQCAPTRSRGAAPITVLPKPVNRAALLAALTAVLSSGAAAAPVREPARPGAAVTPV